MRNSKKKKLNPFLYSSVPCYSFDCKINNFLCSRQSATGITAPSYQYMRGLLTDGLRRASQKSHLFTYTHTHVHIYGNLFTGTPLRLADVECQSTAKAASS